MPNAISWQSIETWAAKTACFLVVALAAACTSTTDAEIEPEKQPLTISELRLLYPDGRTSPPPVDFHDSTEADCEEDELLEEDGTCTLIISSLRGRRFDTDVGGTLTLRAQGPQAALMPWPPPNPSSRLLLSGMRPNKPTGTATLRDYETILRARLEAAGYPEIYYFSIPGGFAMMTPLERFRPDGGPAPADRWIVAKERARWSLTDYGSKLFLGDPGRFRVLIFAITDEPFTTLPFAAGQDDLSRWKMTGERSYRVRVAKEPPASPSTNVTMLVYEFALDKQRLRRLEGQGKVLSPKAHARGVGVR